MSKSSSILRNHLGNDWRSILDDINDNIKKKTKDEIAKNYSRKLDISNFYTFGRLPETDKPNLAICGICNKVIKCEAFKEHVKKHNDNNQKIVTDQRRSQQNGKIKYSKLIIKFKRKPNGEYIIVR